MKQVNQTDIPEYSIPGYKVNSTEHTINSCPHE